jgi:hypothetical protein
MKAANYADFNKYLVLTGIPRGPKSHIYFVDGTNGSDLNVGTNFLQPLKTVSAAYDKCVTGQHDTVLVLAATSAINEAAAITWDKNLTHLVGMGAGTHAAQRTRIVCNAVGLSPFITIAGYGCIFRNLYIWQGQDSALTLINVAITGNRNEFTDVHFAGGGHATQAIDGGASVLITGGSENKFTDCTFGVDTVAAGTGMAALVVAATGGAARNVFKDCRFTLHAGHAGSIFVELLGNSGLDRYHVFENCEFVNLSGTAMTEAFAVAAGFDPANKRVLLKGCALLGATDWDSNNRGIVYLNNGTITGGGNAGLFAVSNAT